MGAKMFKNWFFTEFVPQVGKFLKENNQPRKTLLVMGNCTVHPDIEEIVSGNTKN